MENFNLIIRTLDLSRSGTREETLEGIINYVIYESNPDLPENNLGNVIESTFGIRIHDHEIDEAIIKLIDDDKIERRKSGNLALKPDARLDLRQRFSTVEEEKKRKLEFFKENITTIAHEADYPISEEEILELWEVFTLYLYDCYLTHGKSIIHTLTSQNALEEEDVKKIYYKYSNRIKSAKLEHILETYVQKYPQLLDSNGLNYLSGLANKTESFYSLGLQKNEYVRLYEDLKFDWIAFVDTNFLYSILNLHSHPEDNAAKYVLELGTKMGIKFKYIPETYEELKSRRTDFDKYLGKDFRPSQIKALLESNRLDNFTSTYYQKKLDDPDNTPHPNDILLHSQNSLKAKNIEIYQSKFKALKKNEDYLLDQESQYANYLDLLDEVRKEQKQKPKGPKDSAQIRHDILLREVILHLRNVKAVTLSDIKYYGITLDKTLVKFDSYQLKKNATGVIIPSFFKPSLLLKKLLRHSPLQTEDYLRAFIATISTPAIDNNSSVSKTAIRSLTYLYNMGIDNESLILNCLRDELFLKEFEEKENSEDELFTFVESTINQKITETTKELEELREGYKEKAKRLETVSRHSAVIGKENKILEKRIETVSNDLKLYEKELRRLASKPKVAPFEHQLTIEDELEFREKEQKEVELKKTKKKVDRLTSFVQRKMEEEVNKKVKKRKLTGYGFLLIEILILLHFLSIFMFINSDWNYMSTLIENIDKLNETRRNIAYGMLILLFGSCQGFFIIRSYNRIFNKEAEARFREMEWNKLKGPDDI